MNGEFLKRIGEAELADNVVYSELDISAMESNPAYLALMQDLERASAGCMAQLVCCDAHADNGRYLEQTRGRLTGFKSVLDHANRLREKLSEQSSRA